MVGIENGKVWFDDVFDDLVKPLLGSWIQLSHAEIMPRIELRILSQRTEMRVIVVILHQ